MCSGDILGSFAIVMATKRMLIFGGNGYVGSTIARRALDVGWSVTCACRSGKPGHLRAEDYPDQLLPPPSPLFAPGGWVDKVDWMTVDALDRPSVYQAVQESAADAVVTCIGVLTTDKKLGRQFNGDTNVNIAAAVYETPHVQRMVFVSAARVPLASYFLRGYYEGKTMVEKAMRETLKGRAAILQPGFVYGTRFTSSGKGVPLWVVGKPLECLMLPVYRLTGTLDPAIDVEDVARAAVQASHFTNMPLPDRAVVLKYDDMIAASRAFRPVDHSKIE